MRIFSSLLLLVTCFWVSHTQAADTSHWGALKVGGAIWNIMDEADRKAFHGAYISPPISAVYNIQPSLLVIWADEGQHYFAAGVHKTFYQQGAFSTALAFHAGLVDSPEALGDNVEFYSALSARYQLSKRWATEVEIGHISNGGLGETNPGSEGVVLSLRYTL